MSQSNQPLGHLQDEQATIVPAPEEQGGSVPVLDGQAAGVIAPDEQDNSFPAVSGLPDHLHGIGCVHQDQLVNRSHVAISAETLVKDLTSLQTHELSMHTSKERLDKEINNNKKKCSVKQERIEIVRTAKAQCMRKTLVAKQLLVVNLGILAEAPCVDTSSACKCLNATNRAVYLKLVVASLVTFVLASAFPTASAPVFPAWPPGV